MGESRGSPVPLPSGIVTFVFTDIEGSTRLLRGLGDHYAVVLDRHRELLRTAWRSHGGIEVETEGDSMLVAFSDAVAAVAACTEAQRALIKEQWPADGTVRVRMGVHSGLAYPREGAYVAMAVHQAARVVSAAHGGQVLVSEQTAEIASGLSDISLESRGRFRLRDFDKPVRLLQVTAAELPKEFPSVRALPADGHNLVRPPTSFVGRDDSLAALGELLGPGRVVSVVGPGGVGKTRLVTELGLQIAALWRDGVWFIDLSPLQDGGLIPGAVASAVGCSVSAKAEPWEAVIEHLRQQTALLIFDNCEHLIEAIAHRVAELARECRDIGILATTREPLGLVGEQVWRLAPLITAGSTITPAAQLFAERARAVRADFRLDATNTSVVTAICDRLDGLPLGIELAAARAGVLSPREILQGLDDRFRLLRHRDRTVPERQRTLEALLDWSHQLLSEHEKTALRRLALFAGSFNLETATAALVAVPLQAYDAPDLVWSLADKSLITVEPSANETRYRLFESVRAYALSRLAELDETDSTAVRMADWYLERLGPTVPGSNAVTNLKAAELDNVRGLVAMEAGIGPVRAYELAYAIARFHQVRSTAAAGAEEVSGYVRQITASSPSRVALLAQLAVLLVHAGRTEDAKTIADEANAVKRDTGAPPWFSKAAEHASACVASAAGDFGHAFRITEEALSDAADDFSLATLLNQRAIAAVGLGNFHEARAAEQASLEVDVRLGRNEHAATHYGNLAEIEYRSGNAVAAARNQRSALIASSQAGLPHGLAFSMVIAARLLGDRSSWETSVRLHAKAESILSDLGRVLYESDRRISDALLEDARVHLGVDQYRAERRVGEQLSLPEAIALTDKVLEAVASTAIS